MALLNGLRRIEEGERAKEKKKKHKRNRETTICYHPTSWDWWQEAQPDSSLPICPPHRYRTPGVSAVAQCRPSAVARTRWSPNNQPLHHSSAGLPADRHLHPVPGLQQRCQICFFFFFWDSTVCHCQSGDWDLIGDYEERARGWGRWGVDGANPLYGEWAQTAPTCACYTCTITHTKCTKMQLKHVKK